MLTTHYGHRSTRNISARSVLRFPFARTRHLLKGTARPHHTPIGCLVHTQVCEIVRIQFECSETNLMGNRCDAAKYRQTSKYKSSQKTRCDGKMNQKYECRNSTQTKCIRKTPLAFNRKICGITRFGFYLFEMSYAVRERSRPCTF